MSSRRRPLGIHRRDLKIPGYQGDILELDPLMPYGLAWRRPHGRLRGMTEGSLWSICTFFQTDSYTGNTAAPQWQAAINAWTDQHAEGWTQSAAAEWTYEGSWAPGKSSRDFYVASYMQGIGIASSNYWTMFTELLAGPAGSMTSVANTMAGSDRYSQAPFFASFIGQRFCLSEGIVTVDETNDAIGVRHGHHNSTGGAQTITNLQSKITTASGSESPWRFVAIPCDQVSE